MQHKISLWQLVRHLIQLAAFILFPGLFITVFSSIKSIVMTLIAGSFSWAVMSYDLVIVAAVLPVTLLWGRFFCGWLCSFGAAGDLLSGISRRIFKRRPTIMAPAARAAAGVPPGRWAAAGRPAARPLQRNPLNNDHTKNGFGTPEAVFLILFLFSRRC